MEGYVKALIISMLIDRVPIKLKKKLIMELLTSLGIKLTPEELKELSDYYDNVIEIPPPAPVYSIKFSTNESNKEKSKKNEE